MLMPVKLSLQKQAVSTYMNLIIKHLHIVRPSGRPQRLANENCTNQNADI